MRVAVVKMPYSGSRSGPELSGNPTYIEQGGLYELLEGLNVTLAPTETVGRLPEEENDYGEWHRVGLANGHLADIVAANEKNGYFTVGLHSNCNALMGMLGGVQHAGGRRPLKVGLLWVDAHGDINTPDPAEVPGHGLTVADGPTSTELAAALTEMFKYSKASALGIASTPYGDNDPDGYSLKAAHNLIVGAIKGVQAR